MSILHPPQTLVRLAQRGTAAPSVRLPATRFALQDNEILATDRAVAVETPVNLVYATMPYAVMMATPDDLPDFAIGFSLAEGVIAARTDIRGIAVENGPDGIRLVIDLVPARLHGLLARRRAIAGRTSCGVCGVEDLNAIPHASRRIGQAPAIGLDAIGHALKALSDHQVLNDATRAVHAAAWAGLDGTIKCVREDVGRHNALDKLVGALLDRAADPAQGFVVVTSRCSFEMVEKVATFGAATLVAISAPTSLGIERAVHHDMTLVGVARHDAITVFTGAERIVASGTVPAR